MSLSAMVFSKMRSRDYLTSEPEQQTATHRNKKKTNLSLCHLCSDHGIYLNAFNTPRSSSHTKTGASKGVHYVSEWPCCGSYTQYQN